MSRFTTHLRENDGTGLQAAMSADGMHGTDRNEAQDSEVLFGRVPAEGRPGDAPQPASGALPDVQMLA